MVAVKVIFITLEAAMLFGVIVVTFLTNWIEVLQTEDGWMFQVLLVLMAMLAVVFQKEQQAIEWEEKE